MRAIAYAMPFEGTHVRVFYDRIAHMPNRSAVLAYVFVHELTHMLQGIARHSATGIMKARWTTSDIDKMGCQHLAFTPLDIDLIQRGLAAGSRAEDKPAGEASEDSRFSAASTLSFRAP
ncbi:MAG TPA: hypothetical protein VKX49_15695 [Bryobacteraceae bacterium]|nr:hypothetical protein [Bryobacteraceae bacterium]